MKSGWFQSSTVLRRLSLADHGHGHGHTLLTSYSIPSYTGPAALRESLPTKQGVASGLEHQHQGAHISGSGGAGSKLHSKLEREEWPSRLSTLDRNEWAQEQRWRGWTLCISGGQQGQCYEMQINISSTSSAHFPVFFVWDQKKEKNKKVANERSLSKHVPTELTWQFNLISFVQIVLQEKEKSIWFILSANMLTAKPSS